PAERAKEILRDYAFTLVSSSTDGHVIPWRMRFFHDSSNRIRFEVLDPTSGERRTHHEPGTHFSAGGIRFENASGSFQLDGSGYSVRVDRVENGRLFGYWEHYSFGIRVGRDGKPVPEPAGHFCAVARK
ncbi:MAG TPA: hypothetical protein VGC52_11260, partial [Gemmatimonadaceae bacterium]